ncbi:MAG: hypothetical protein SPE01_07050 [Candidatus Spyradocola sp.]|nr:hypothetical protein [Candidatus Spyradocola sp.]
MERKSEVRRPKGRTRAMIYHYINDCVAQKGYPPTLREIAEAVGVRSTGTVARHLRSLEAQCLISRRGRLARAISTHEPGL